MTSVEPRQSLSQVKERQRQSALASGAPSINSYQEQTRSIPVRSSADEAPFLMANNQIDISGSYEIEPNVCSVKKEEPAKEDSQLGSGKQEALAKNHMKKSPSLEELEFTGNKKDRNTS